MSQQQVQDLTVPDETRGSSVFGSSATQLHPSPPRALQVSRPPARRGRQRFIGRLLSVAAVAVIAVANGVSIALVILSLAHSPGAPGFTKLTGQAAGEETTTTTVLSPAAELAGGSRQHRTRPTTTTTVTDVTAVTGPIGVASTVPPVITTVPSSPPTVIAPAPTTTTTVSAPAYVSPDYYGAGCSGPGDVLGCDPSRVCPRPDYPHFVASPPPRCVP